MDRGFLIGEATVNKNIDNDIAPPDAANVVSFPKRPETNGFQILRDQHGEVTEIVLCLTRNKGKFRASKEWLAAKQVSVQFAEAFFDSTRNNRISSIHQKANQIHVFFKFIDDSGLHGVSLNSFDTLIFDKYISWLNEKFANSGTKANLLGAVRTVVEQLGRDPRYKNELSPKLRIARNPWPGRSKSSKPRRAIDTAHLVAIERACMKEMAKVMDRFDEGERMIESGKSLLATGTKNDARPEVVLARLSDVIGEWILDRRKFLEENPDLAHAIERCGGFDAAASRLYASPWDLIPFVVMFTIRTAFNPETVLLMDRSARRDSPLLSNSVEIDGRDGRQRIDARVRIVGRKNRSKSDQIRTFPNDLGDRDNPVRIWSDVERLSRRIRPFAEGEARNLLFLSCFPGRSRSKPSVGSFLDKLPGYLEAFGESNGLDKFALAQIRPTICEIVDRLTGGDLKAQQAILNHWNSDTTDAHYVSPEAKTRRMERLAAIQDGRERYVETSGRSDPRDFTEMSTRRAATSGFECADPHSSPIPGQERGRLCTAWGLCATCPLAGVNPKDSQALAHLLRFDRAIEDAKTRLHPARWLQWEPVQVATRKWIHKFSDKGVRQAAEDFVLPPLTAIE